MGSRLIKKKAERTFNFISVLIMTTNNFSTAEIQQIRTDTTGTASRIHFNNAGSSLPPDIVVQTVTNYLQQEALEGGYEMENNHREELANVYNLIARLINATPGEIAITENASAAWGMAFNGIEFSEGDVILASEYEYVTNILGLLAVRNKRVEVRVIPNNEKGDFSISALEETISPKTKLIAVTHISSSAGGILPVAEIGRIARKHNILYLVDACQSIGQLPVDVREINCDIMSATGRKYLRGPRGTGFLYVRSSVQDMLKPVFMDGFSIIDVNEQGFQLKNDAKRFELFENSRALRLGLGKAVEYALNLGLDRISARIRMLASILRQELSNLPRVTVRDRGKELSGIVTFSVTGIESMWLQSELAKRKINLSLTTTKATLFYMQKYQLDNILRASVHYYNTEEEISIFVITLRELTVKN